MMSLPGAFAQSFTQADFKRESHQADQFLDENHVDAAKKIFAGLISTPYAGVHEYIQLSYCYLYSLPGENEYDLAVKYARKALMLDPESGPAYAALAQVSLERNDNAQCIQLATRGWTCKEPDPHSLYLRARAYAALHKYSEALADFEKWDKVIEPIDAKQRTFGIEGEILEKLGRTDDAIKKYKIDMKLHPETASKSLIRCLQNAKRYPEAIEQTSLMLKRNPEDSDAYNTRANLKVLAKDWKGAISDYTEAIKLSPTSSYYKNRAKAYEGLGQMDMAKKDLNDANKSYF